MTGDNRCMAHVHNHTDHEKTSCRKIGSKKSVANPARMNMTTCNATNEPWRSDCIFTVFLLHCTPHSSTSIPNFPFMWWSRFAQADSGGQFLPEPLLFPLRNRFPTLRGACKASPVASESHDYLSHRIRLSSLDSRQTGSVCHHMCRD